MLKSIIWLPVNNCLKPTIGFMIYIGGRVVAEPQQADLAEEKAKKLNLSEEGVKGKYYAIGAPAKDEADAPILRNKHISLKQRYGRKVVVTGGRL